MKGHQVCEVSLYHQLYFLCYLGAPIDNEWRLLLLFRMPQLRASVIFQIYELFCVTSDCILLIMLWFAHLTTAFSE